MSYPAWICIDCGREHGRAKSDHVATFQHDTCGWCGESALVTEPRDYGYPPAPKGQP